MRFRDKVKLFFHEARSKLTTYVGITIAAVSLLAAHAEELLQQLPSLAPMLPKVVIVQTALMYVSGGLGLFAIYTRVRRSLKSPPPASP